MTEQELLRATGGKWRVSCFRNGNWREADRTLFVRACSREVAEDIARSVSGRRNCRAVAYDPTKDFTMRGYVQQVTE